MSQETELHLENYEGPLDLLLDLVKDKKMDIFAVDLEELATQYLKLIDKLKDHDLDLASEYLVMAATLLQLKTKMLLEDPNAKEEVELEKKDLLKQLAEYQQYKLVAEDLRKKEALRKNIFIKNPEDYNKYAPEIDESKLDGNSDAIKLIQQMRKMFERTHANKLRSSTIDTFNLSPAERRVELIELFNNHEHITFEEVFDVPSINHFVVTMLTLLDMARKQEVKLYQEEQFGDIKIEKGVINE